MGVYLHGREVLAGGDLATRARQRRGITDAARARAVRRRIKDRGWVTDDGVAVGQDRTGAAVRIPVCGSRAAMTLVAGATGSGKTVTMALMALAAIRRGFGVVVVDPKPDDFLLELLRRCRGPGGPPTHGLGARWRLGLQPVRGRHRHRDRRQDPLDGDLHRAALSAARPALSRACRPVAPLGGHDRQPGHRPSSTCSRAGCPRSRARLPDQKRSELLDYLETLTPQQERDLAGTRDRLAILAESDVRRLARSEDGGRDGSICGARWRTGDVVLFRLDADRRPLATGMLASAVIQDLVAISADRQHGDHRPGLVLIDEFSAIAAKEVARLFSRARGAQLSVVLGTQELADLEAVLGAVVGGRDPRPDPRQPRRARLAPPGRPRLGRDLSRRSPAPAAPGSPPTRPATGSARSAPGSGAAPADGSTGSTRTRSSASEWGRPP